MIKTLCALLTTGFLAIGLAGCGASPPGCADTNTKALVVRIARTEIKKQLGEEAAAKVNLQVENARTQSEDKSTGACSCIGDLVVSGPAGKNTLPITYTSEPMEGKHGEFYVTVFGL